MFFWNSIASLSGFIAHKANPFRQQVTNILNINFRRRNIPFAAGSRPPCVLRKIAKLVFGHPIQSLAVLFNSGWNRKVWCKCGLVSFQAHPSSTGLWRHTLEEQNTRLYKTSTEEIGSLSVDENLVNDLKMIQLHPNLMDPGSSPSPYQIAQATVSCASGDVFHFLWLNLPLFLLTGGKWLVLIQPQSR